MHNGNQSYWESRFSKEGKIWGDEPSKSALYCLELFRNYNIEKMLVPGSGYGRHTKFFSENSYQVVGIEISESAIQIAKKFDTSTDFINNSVLDMKDYGDIYDAIFCFNTLHLFLNNDRLKFLKKCFISIKPKGYLFFTAFSEKESSFGKGKELEKNTFKSKVGRPTHYFSEDDLKQHFKDLNIIEMGIIEEQENHGEMGFHTHLLRYIFAQK